MIQINKPLSPNTKILFQSHYELEDMLFFDIETTGFSPEVSSLYLIGCGYYQDGSFNMTQWFADDYESEKLLLQSFFTFLKQFKVLFHYNGQGFDIPYIEKKCKQYKLSYTFDDVKSIDIYKKIFPYKKFFGLPNYKQKTVEEYLHIAREDQFSGGDLIQVYGTYLKRKFCGKDEEAKDYLDPLLLHNADDIRGLIAVSQILNYTTLLEQPWSVLDTQIHEDSFLMKFELPCKMLAPFSFGNDFVHIHAVDTIGEIEIRIYKNELKFFYDNYKDYYYLPKEDMAIHKSVAFYVDKEFRTKAKAANCYSKKTGRFIPQYGERITPYFKQEYHDKITYLELTDEFLANKTTLNMYANQLIKFFINRKK